MTRNEEGAALPEGVRLETDLPYSVHQGDSGSWVKVMTAKDGDLRLFVPEGVWCSATLQGSGKGDCVVDGPGDGFAYRSGSGNGNARRSGSGKGDAWRKDEGSGDAERTGSGDGDAVRYGSGNGNASRDGSGSGNACRSGEGDGWSARNGPGDGHSLRAGEGEGDANRDDEGRGDAVRSGAGEGDGIRLGGGDGNAEKFGTGNGVPHRAGAGLGFEKALRIDDEQKPKTLEGCIAMVRVAVRYNRGLIVEMLEEPPSPDTLAECGVGYAEDVLHDCPEQIASILKSSEEDGELWSTKMPAGAGYTLQEGLWVFLLNVLAREVIEEVKKEAAGIGVEIVESDQGIGYEVAGWQEREESEALAGADM